MHTRLLRSFFHNTLVLMRQILDEKATQSFGSGSVSSNSIFRETKVISCGIKYPSHICISCPISLRFNFRSD